ncbi:MAG TPA: hypothetical protein VKN18_13885 [Blastocatellia bacterium]|nr:hypothetical protein [Blastocatellia bacterium]
MNDPASDIIRMKRSVSMRTRLLALQDNLALTFIIAGLVGAALLLFISLRPIEIDRWVIILGVVIVSAAVALIRWEFSKRRNPDASFLIDSRFALEDRVAASTAVIERGGPRRPLEEALIQDTAERLRGKQPETVVPYRLRRWYALLLVSVISVIAAVMVPVRPQPRPESLASERGDIEAAGETLERAAAEIEQATPAGTETAALAKEQGEIGRGFRGVKLTRAEALRKLSALEERIRKRHDLLAETRADEIVSLADRRLGSTISEISAAQTRSTRRNVNQAESFEAQARSAKENPTVESGSSTNDQPKSTATGTGTSPEEPRSVTPNASPNGSNNKAASVSKQSRSTEQSSSANSNTQNGQTAPPRVDSKEQTGSTKVNDQSDSSAQVSSIQRAAKDSADKKEAGDQSPNAPHQDESNKSVSNPLDSLPTSLASEAARRLPALSSELLKKAAEIRANQLTRQDIEKLRKAAESLSRELSQIGQSQELKKALEEMARQARPEEIEQVARELGNQEEIKKELEAAGRLLSENQQAKETVAGIASRLARRGDNEQSRAQLAGNPDKQNKTDATGNIRSNKTVGEGRTLQSNINADARLEGQGRELSIRGKLQQKPGGEYLYLQSKTSTGAARAPYSSAYPQYRREAERSVQRSQVPSNLRSVVRRYFDAINPDGKK